MTDKPDDLGTTPEPAPYLLRIAIDPTALNRATAHLNEQFARMRFRNAARAALAACLDRDDEQAARLLDGLDDAQLYAIEGAASGLAIHASRHRKRLAAIAQADGEDGAERPDGPGDESVCDEPTCICHDLAVPNDDDGRDPLAAARDLTEQQAAGCPLNCPPGYCRADPAPDDEQPDEASDEYDLDTDPDALRRNLDEVIVFLDGRGPKMVHDAVWARVRPVLRIHREKLAEQRQRADQSEDRLRKAEQAYTRLADQADDAEAARDRWRKRADDAEQQAEQQAEADAAAVDKARRERNEANRRAETLRASRDEIREKLTQAETALREAQDDVRYVRGELSKADDENRATGERAKRAEAEAADWRTTAAQYEQQRDLWQADARRFAGNSDHWRKRADQAEAILAKAREEVAKASRAGAAVLQTWVVRTLLGIPDGTDAPDAWRP